MKEFKLNLFQNKEIKLLRITQSPIHLITQKKVVSLAHSIIHSIIKSIKNPIIKILKNKSKIKIRMKLMI